MSEPIEKTTEIVEMSSSKTISPWRETWREFKRNKIALVGMLIVLFFILLALLQPFWQRKELMSK